MPVSFRWSNEVNNAVEEGSKKLRLSKTQYVVNAVNLLHFLVNNEKFHGMTAEQIKTKIEALTDNNLHVSRVSTSTYTPTTNTKRKPGYIYDHVFEYIKSQSDPSTTTEISNALHVPKSTVRAYVKKLTEEYPDNIIIIRGRPNQIYYKE